MPQNSRASSLLPSLHFYLASLGLVHGILSLAAETDRRLAWEQLDRWIRNLAAGMHLPVCSPMRLLQSPVSEDRRECTPLPTFRSVPKEHTRGKVNFMPSTLLFEEHFWHFYS